MDKAWFILLSMMLIFFTVLAGWDFGVGCLHYLAGRTNGQRRAMMATLQPLWTWNEVWLIASGGVLFMAFPRVMATAFPCFYLAIYFLLWCLLLRGIAMEFVGLLADRMWQSFWDAVFFFANVLLAFFFGVAFGNLMRGLPINGNISAGLSLFTDLTPWGQVGILDWYTLSVGVLALVLLMSHGASYLYWRTAGAINVRARRLIPLLWSLTLLCVVVVSVETWVVRPDLFTQALPRPTAWLALALFCIGLCALVSGLFARREVLHFAGSVLIVIALMTGSFASLYPDMLYSTLGPQWSLTAHNSAAHAHALALGLIWWPLALAISVACAMVVARRVGGKIESPP